MNHNSLMLEELDTVFLFLLNSFSINDDKFNHITRPCPTLSNIHVNDNKKSCRDAKAKFWTRYSIDIVSSSNARLCRSFFQPTNVWITFMIRGIPNPVITFLYVLAFRLAIKGCSNILYLSSTISFAVTDSCIIDKAITSL